VALRQIKHRPRVTSTRPVLTMTKASREAAFFF